MKRILIILVLLSGIFISSFSQELFEPTIYSGIANSFFAFRTSPTLYPVGDPDYYFYYDGEKEYPMFFDPPKDGTIHFGDYDNDNYPDILLFTVSEGKPVCEIYENEYGIIGNSIGAELKGMYSNRYSDKPWIDYNNDGLKDLFLFGMDENLEHRSILYKNLGNKKFEDSGISFIGFAEGYAEWGNVNNDGFPDLILKGKDVNGNYRTTIYTNHEGDYFEPTNSFNSKLGDAKWGDYDADGDFDLLMINSEDWLFHLTIFQNENGAFSETGIVLDTMSLHNCQWADLNNDGYLDVIAFGEVFGLRELHVYLNDGLNNYIDSFQVSYPGYTSEPAIMSTGDRDKDGDLDFLFRDINNNVVYFNNTSEVTNELPSAPTNLRTKRLSSGMVLSWDRSTDVETPQKSLTYNVRIGSSPGAYDIVAPHVEMDPFRQIGFVKKPEYGNASSDTFKIIRDLEPGTYYWSVQAVDHIYTGSDFSEEQSFTYLPAFSQNDTIFPQLERSNAVFGDYDLDGDYDLLVSGQVPIFHDSITRLYKNNGDSTYSEVPFQFEGVVSGKMAFGDYNNDNYLDILVLSGSEALIATAYIYRNDRNDAFTLIKQIEFDEPSNSFFGFWGDYDNDGDQDVYCSRGLTHLLLINNGDESFTEEIIPVRQWNATNFVCDYDNDADLDLFASNGLVSNSCILRNDGDLVFSQIENGFTGLRMAGADVADYNDDGYLDFVLTGADSIGFTSTHIFENNGNGKFLQLEHDIRYVALGQASWGDIDNDNDVDLLVGGKTVSVNLKLYENRGNNNFVELFSEYYGNNYITYAIVGDYNSDQNLDMVSNGILFSSNLESDKEIPKAPQNLAHTFDGFDVLLSWDPIETDLEYKQFSYNVRIGTSPGSADIVSPLSDLVTGKRRIFSLGNAQLCEQFKIVELEASTTYYWSVQAVDKGFTGGKWAPERSFTTPSLLADFDSQTVCAGEVISFTDLSTSPNEAITSWEWDLGDGTTDNSQNIEYMYTTAGTYQVSLLVSTNSINQQVIKEIVVNPSPEVDFDFEVISLGEHTPFTNLTETNSAEMKSWYWDFGDGFTSLLEDPEYHKYEATGSYKVTLTATTEDGCTASATKEVSVCQEALPKPTMIVHGPAVWYMACSNDSANYYKWYLDGDEIPGADEYLYVANQTTGIYKVAVSVDDLCFSESNEKPIPYKKALQGTIPPSKERSEDGQGIFDNLKIYPNPTTGMFTLEMDNSLRGDLDIDVINSGAVKVLHMSIEKTSDHFKTMIDLTGQGNGMYVIELSLLEHRISRKLIVE